MATDLNSTTPHKLIKPGARAKDQSASAKNYFALFLKSREAMGVSGRTLEFYTERLSKVLSKIDYINVTREQIRDILNSIPPNKYGLSTRHASYRALKAFFNWLSRDYGIANPMAGLPAPILGKPILPTLTPVSYTHLTLPTNREV